ncbi:type II secretion system protein N [Microbulbifer sp. SAOS-129_SWC]|uniref:type II secretion system protein N n=1 Tax=Microbulbifer sp. SAOS-129_SWC TaxID=3145235 RepID=UPI0032180F40
MSAVSRITTSLGERFAQGETRKAMSRSTAASIAVVSGWLLVNLLAYGGALWPQSGSESLLVERNASTGANVARVQSLPNTPFFGRAPVKSDNDVPELDVANIPITQLNLVLSGVLDNSSKSKASALVAEKGKPAERVYVGDKLPGGAELYRVAVDHIVLRRNGKMEKLTYPDADGRPSVPLRKYSNYTRQAAQAAQAVNASGRGDNRQSIRERLEQLRNLARQRRTQRQ